MSPIILLFNSRPGIEKMGPSCVTAALITAKWMGSAPALGAPPPPPPWGAPRPRPRCPAATWVSWVMCHVSCVMCHDLNPRHCRAETDARGWSAPTAGPTPPRSGGATPRGSPCVTPVVCTSNFTGYADRQARVGIYFVYLDQQNKKDWWHSLKEKKTKES